jgi:hypothetical protein
MPTHDQATIRNPRARARNNALLKRKKKTQMCQHLLAEGHCRFGDSCWFAHSSDEIARVEQS